MSDNEFLKVAKRQMKNKDCLNPENVGSQFETGDPCGEEEGACDRAIHRRDFGKPETCEPETATAEAHCPVHGIVASETER